MADPDVTLTDFALALLCAAFVVALLPGAGVAGGFALLFAALALASLTAALWHGWYPGQHGGVGGGLWSATLAAIALASFALWQIAGAMLAGGQLAGVIGWIAWGQLAVSLLMALIANRSFVLASALSLPPTLAVGAGYGLGLAAMGGARLGLGLAGIGLALAGAGLQAAKIGLPALRLSPNGFYHLVQMLAFGLLFLSVPAVQALTSAQ